MEIFIRAISTIVSVELVQLLFSNLQILFHSVFNLSCLVSLVYFLFYPAVELSQRSLQDCLVALCVKITWITCAAASGVPCRRSWPLIERTLSFRYSFPFLAAKPPSNKSRIKIPGSSVFLISLMPSGSDRSLLTRVTWITCWFIVGLESGCTVLETNPFSCNRRRWSTTQGWRRKDRAWQWVTLLMLSPFIWEEDKNNTLIRRLFSNYYSVYKGDRMH